ncbi:hypothetical protein CAI21_03315 [Alkalilimnicola ehrlichii]|uniref:Uncharacterized protein n=1 Tax=Alkalilimnicola ehrlichii TaxID=351052 RepID=A0A3E0X3R7_9GAMM|nr:hypothetical protein [Alkalilimnicola ehrlichii]RFA31014.1 hypothetical protein CAI21_03315 [Alkalilimnicola ehrlichii]RFA38967.1 hypothetical protein CAL65_03465 [Alkalilimnicola ehrlichii]
MASYKAKQIARIKDAVLAARTALRESGDFDPLRFAKVYVAHEGVQLPGRVDDDAERERVGQALLRALRLQSGGGQDPDVARELHRIEQEVDWLRYACQDDVVAFRAQLGPQAEKEPACQALVKEGNGLGPGLYGKYDVIVLRPECSDCRFVPVHQHELEW